MGTSAGGAAAKAAAKAVAGALGAGQDNGAKEPTPPSSPILPGDEGLGPAFARIRNTARWIVGIFGTGAAAVVAVLPFAGFGDLSGDDLALAIVGLTLATAGLTLCVRAGAHVAEPVAITTWELVLAEQAELRGCEPALAEWPPPSTGLAGSGNAERSGSRTAGSSHRTSSSTRRRCSGQWSRAAKCRRLASPSRRPPPTC